MKHLLALLLLTCLSLSVAADPDVAPLVRGEINDTISIKLDGQVKGAKLERHSVKNYPVTSTYHLTFNDIASVPNHLADLVIRGKGNGYLGAHLYISKGGWPLACDVFIKDSAEFAKPQVELMEECTKNWRITDVSGIDGNYEFTLYAN